MTYEPHVLRALLMRARTSVWTLGEMPLRRQRSDTDRGVGAYQRCSWRIVLLRVVLGRWPARDTHRFRSENPTSRPTMPTRSAVAGWGIGVARKPWPTAQPGEEQPLASLYVP